MTILDFQIPIEGGLLKSQVQTAVIDDISF